MSTAKKPKPKEPKARLFAKLHSYGRLDERGRQNPGYSGCPRLVESGDRPIYTVVMPILIELVEMSKYLSMKNMAKDIALLKSYVNDLCTPEQLEKEKPKPKRKGRQAPATKLLACLLLLLLTSQAYAQDQRTIITQNHADGSAVLYQSKSEDPKVLANTVRGALKQNQAGDSFTVAAGEYVFTEPLSLHGITLTGAGRDVTFFRNNGIHSDKVGGAFGLGDTTLDGITFESKSNPDYEDDRCLSLDVKAPVLTTTIRNCRGLAGAWGIYGWPIENNVWNLTLENTEVFSGCQCLTGQGSGNDSAQNFSVAKCLFVVDPARSKCAQNQAVRNPTYGGSLAVTLRSGKHAFSDVTIRVKGNPLCTWASCITDTYENGPRDALKIIAQNLVCEIEPNGTPEANCHDVRLQNAKVNSAAQFLGKNTGSGKFNSLLMWVPATGGVK